MSSDKERENNGLKCLGLLENLTPEIENVEINWSKITNANDVYNLNENNRNLAIKKAKCLQKTIFTTSIIYT